MDHRSQSINTAPRIPQGTPGGFITSVFDFGARGDGVTDDSAAIQAAIDFVNGNGGGMVMVPARHFISTPLVIRDSVTLAGTNRLASRIIGNMASPLISAPNTAHSFVAADRVLNAFLRDLGFDNQSTDAGSACVEWSQISVGGIDRCDLRNTGSGLRVATGLIVNNNTINNHFRDIQVTGAVTGYSMANGANDNLWENCRVSGCVDGFIMRPGVDGSVNNVGFIMCKVETFTGTGFDIDGDGGSNFAECTLLMPRLTSGPTGIFLGRDNAAQVRNSGVFMPHYDGITGDSLLDNSPALNRNWQNLQGAMFPVRVGAAGSNAQPTVNDFSLLLYNQGNTQNLFRNNVNSVPQDVVVEGVSVQSLNGTQRVTSPRYAVTSGGGLVAGDFALSAGWGSTASISSVTARDTRGTFTVTSAGTGQGANPTITLTFTDGAMVAAPAVQLGRSGGDQLSVANTWTTTTTTIVITFNGTPVAAETFEFTFLAVA